MRYQAPDRKTSYGGEFQLTRLSRPLLEQFYKLTASISSQKVDVDVAFQLFISRCMKLIVEKATRSLKLKNAVAPIATPVETISLREKNAIRYMAGYVMMKLRKKFGRKISDASVIYIRSTNGLFMCWILLMFHLLLWMLVQ